MNVRNGTTVNNAVFKPQFELGSTATAYEPFTGNTYPVVFPALGKNLFDGELEQGGIIGNSGAETGSTERVRTKGFIPLTEGQYTISAVGVGQVYYYSYNMDGTYNVEESSGFKNLPFTINVLGDRKYRFAFRVSSSSEAVSPSDVSNVQIEEGSSATTYEPYTNTVYGGTLNVTTGVLAVDKKSFAFKDLVTPSSTQVTWLYNSTNNLFETANRIVPVGSANTETGIVCACYNSRPYGYNSSYLSENSVVWAHTSGTLRVRDNRYTDVSTWKTAIADEQIVVPLDDPIVYQLTPQQITSLIGTNTMWADTNGDCTAKYLKKG